MKRLLVLLAACGSHADGKPKDAAPAGFTLHCTAPAVGLRVVEEDKETSKLTLTRAGSSVSMSELDHELTHTDVLAVSGDAVTRIRVQYDAKESDQQMDDRREGNKSPLDAHTYVLSVETGALVATHDDGSAVTADEQAALAEAHADLGKPPALSRVLCAHAWIANQRVDLVGDELAALGRNDSSVKPTAGSFTFMGAGTDDATFASDVTLVKDDDTSHVETHLRGYVRILVDGVRPAEITDDGDSTGELKGQMAGTSLSGETNGHITYSYSQ